MQTKKWLVIFVAVAMVCMLLPVTGDLTMNFGAFIERAKQKGGVYVPSDGSLWYKDK